MKTMHEVVAELCEQCPTASSHHDHGHLRLTLDAATLPQVVRKLRTEGAWLAGIIAEERDQGIILSYPFLAAQGAHWLVIELAVAAAEPPSIAELDFSADWQEREIEDLFGLRFHGHPQLGDFVLHNEQWPEEVGPMRRRFDAHQPFPQHENPQYRPPKILHAEGAFTMTVGPVYSDIVEAAQFQLETIGEEVVSTRPRLFYKYRGIEKIAEGQEAWRAVLLAERLNGTCAVAHALCCVQALETISGCEVPPHARRLRLIAAELERLRSHTATIAAICKSTGLSVPTNHAYSLLEQLLRLSCEHFEHRYLFGFVVPGGVSIEVDAGALGELVRGVHDVAATLAKLGEDLTFDNSFLDRIKKIDIIEPGEAQRYGVLGPIGRASRRGAMDLRRRAPYADYAQYVPNEILEEDGDGYARLRVFLAEAAESARLIESATRDVPDGSIHAAWEPVEGAALGWAEAPAGAAVQWLRVDGQGRIARLRILPPAFVNWHAFHLAAENFAFQDFPITLATIGLSVAEADR